MKYILFGRGTGLRVSSLSLGTALFGTAWGYGAEPDEAHRIMAAYADAGGNFIDTADSYQFGQSEEIIGKWLGSRRREFVLASKYTLGAMPEGSPVTTGNSRLNMVRSVENSLRRLKTDAIDLYWVHMADGDTSVDEIVRGLDDLVRAGKILYPGFSDFPAWRVARGATIAELRGWSAIAGIQIEYSLAERSGDRELLPMAEAFGLGVAAWSPLGGGLLSGKYRRKELGRADTFGAVVHREDDPRKTATLDAIEAVAEEIGATLSQVSLAWLIAKGVVPVIGPRTADQLADNLGADDLALTNSQIGRLEHASTISLGFPHDFLASEPQRSGMTGGAFNATRRPWPPPA